MKIHACSCSVDTQRGARADQHLSTKKIHAALHSCPARMQKMSMSKLNASHVCSTIGLRNYHTPSAVPPSISAALVVQHEVNDESDDVEGVVVSMTIDPHIVFGSCNPCGGVGSVNIARRATSAHRKGPTETPHPDGRSDGGRPSSHLGTSLSWPVQ